MGLFNKIKSLADNAFEVSKEKISSFIDSEKAREIALHYFVKIDFSSVLHYLRQLEPLNPKLSIAIAASEKIQIIVDEYHQSDKDDKDKIIVQSLLCLTQEIDFETVAEILEPVANTIPFGKLLLTGIKLIVSFTNKK